MQHGVADSRDAHWTAFIGRVRDHLHLVLAMSPVGDLFRERCVLREGLEFSFYN